MDVSPSRILAPARIVGLTLIVTPAGSTTRMARLVHRPGHFGREASAALRSVYPVIAGLGGWFTGALVVLTTMPGLPRDDALLPAASVGLPLGLGVYLAWVSGDWWLRTEIIGLSLAVAGPLLRGWLGFRSTERFVALIITMAAAIVGANLLLLAFDMTPASQRTGRAVEGNRRVRPVALQAWEDLR